MCNFEAVVKYNATTQNQLHDEVEIIMHLEAQGERFTQFQLYTSWEFVGLPPVEELDSPSQCARRAIAEAKRRS
jgi:hypothetical protein